MKILDVLKKDHKKVDDLLMALADQCIKDDEALPATFAKVRDLLIEHSAGEEATFYPSLMTAENAAMPVQKARSQHEAIAGTLDRLGRMLSSPHSERMTIIDELRTRVSEHVRFEESELFSLAEKRFDDREAKRLGNDMLRREPKAHPLLSKL